MRKERMAALAALAAVRKDADLARLSGLSTRLASATQARQRLEAALAREIAQVVQQPELPGFRALDAHVILSERARTALETEIARIAREHAAQRRVCTVSFGRAEVLAQLRERLARAKKPGV